MDGRLTTAAQRHSVDMADRDTMSHTGGDGSSFDERIRAAGYPEPAAENIAFGQSSASSVVAAWMDSAGHRRNILDCDYTAIGVGFDPAATTGPRTSASERSVVPARLSGRGTYREVAAHMSCDECRDAAMCRRLAVSVRQGVRGAGGAGSAGRSRTSGS